MHQPLHVPIAAVQSQWVNLGLTQLTNSTAKSRITPPLLSVLRQFVQENWPESSGDRSWGQEESTDSSSSFCPCRVTETPALALLFIELFQNTRFIPVQQCSIKHCCCRGCLLLLYVCWPPLHLFQRGTWTATSKSHKVDPSLHGQQHQLILSVLTGGVTSHKTFHSF